MPEDLPPDELSLERALQFLQERQEGPKVIGTDPDTGKPVYMMSGRFGPYVQLGDAEEEIVPPKTSRGKPKVKQIKPLRASLLRGMGPEEVSLSVALQLLSLPRTLGERPVTDKDGTTMEPVVAANGRFGPYLKWGKETRSIPAEHSVLTITLEDAEALLAQPARRGAAKSTLREVGTDPSTERTIKLMEGRYGPYVTDGATNASLPRDASAEELTLAAAIELIRAREKAPPKAPRKKAPAKKGAAAATDAAPKKAPAKKAPAKKAPAKKAPAKKAAKGD